MSKLPFDPRKMKIELAKQKFIEELEPFVDQILKILGHPEALVTDESEIGDFYPSKRAMERLSKKAGCEVYYDDLVWQVAQRIKLKE